MFYSVSDEATVIVADIYSNKRTTLKQEKTYYSLRMLIQSD